VTCGHLGRWKGHLYGSSQTSGSYDAGGHAHRRVTGVFDLTTDYDAAERVTAVSETGARTLKLFAYDDPAGSTFGQCTGGKCKGKLAAAARYNYAPDLGTVAMTETYQYNGVGGLASRRDRTIGSSSTFDGQSFFFGQTNNDLGGVATITYPCRSDSNANCLSADRTPPAITMGYSAGTLTNVGSYASNITYHPNGVIGTVTHGSGSTAVSEIWDPDTSGIARPSTIRATNVSSTELWNSGGYSFDGSGNIKAIGNTAYYYDAYDRLSGWKTPGTNSAYDWIGRRYDAFGNYLSAFEKVCMPQVSGQAQRCFTSNFATQQVTGTTNHYSGVTYDDAGNVTAQSGRTFTWDSLGVMMGATANGRTFRYLYTPDDERVAVVERVVGGGNVTRNRTTWSARDFENRLLTTWTDDATSGTRTITWKEDEIWRGGTLLANLSSSGTKHYILDHLGSPRFVTNASGQAVGPQNFAPFGSGGSTDSGTLQFAGMERDLTAVGGTFPDLPDYDHQRFYDLDWGRFLSADMVGGSSPTPQTWNRYTYARNNPLRFIDPNGNVEVDLYIRHFISAPTVQLIHGLNAGDARTFSLDPKANVRTERHIRIETDPSKNATGEIINERRTGLSQNLTLNRRDRASGDSMTASVSRLLDGSVLVLANQEEREPLSVSFGATIPAGIVSNLAIVVSPDGKQINAFGMRSSFPSMEINATIGSTSFAIYRGTESGVPMGFGIFGRSFFNIQCSSEKDLYRCH